VFDRETKLYRAEGISAADLVWTTNDEVINILTGKKTSLLAVLEDQCLAPGGSDEKFLSAIYTTLKGSAKLVKAKVSGNINFIVVHTIGEIQYNVTNFLIKNKDVVKAELVDVIKSSPNLVTKSLFENVVVERGKLAKGQLIGSQFMSQLEALMGLINQTEPHFIRCVKPNETKKPAEFVPSKVLIQLHSLSILEALQLRNLGYSYRRPFTEFLYQFRFVNMGLAASKEEASMAAAKQMLEEVGIPKDKWAIGRTMVFMKADAAKLMAHKQREALAAWQPLVVVIESAWTKIKYREKMSQVVPSLVRVQAHFLKLVAAK